MKNRYLNLIFLVLIVLSACNNKLEINGPLKETTVVYGLLNHVDDVQYIKVYKAFVTEDNLYDAAKNPDNIYYYDSINVYLEKLRLDGNMFVSEGIIEFDTTTAIPKDAGVFSSPYQVLYRTKDGQPALDNSYYYRVVVENKYTGKQTSAITNLISYPSVFDFNPFRLKSFYPNTTLMINPFTRLTMVAPENSAQIMVNFEFYYRERNAITNEVVKKGPIVINLASSKSLKHDTDFDLNLNGGRFLTTLSSKLEADPNIVRYDDTCSIVVWAAGEEFVRYNDVNAPSISIVEERPSYTNVANGLGLFSSRFYYRYDNVLLNKSAVDSLKHSPTVKNLNFYAY